MSFAQISKQPKLGYKSVKLINIGTLQFKDLNRNGKLDPYEDWRLPYEKRAKDLVNRMTVEEKVGIRNQIVENYEYQKDS